MRQPQQPHSAGQKSEVRLQALDGVLSYALKHCDWSAPLADTEHWERALPRCANYRVRAILIQHAEEGQLIKVITREMPDSLAVRPPSWVDLREVSLFGDARLRRDIQSVSTCSSFCYFFPSPSYLKSLPSGRFESQEQRTWIVDEAGRIWRELQREDNRVLVRTNVPNEMAEVIHSLTMKLFAQLQMYPTIGRSDAYVAMVATAKAAGLALPLEPGEEIELLRLAKEHLLKRRDGHVRNHFDSLRPRGWRF